MPRMSFWKRAYAYLYFPRLAPVLMVLSFHPARRIIYDDLARWQRIKHLGGTPSQALVNLLTFCPEFRSLVYWRLGGLGIFLKLFAPGLRSLHLSIRPAAVGPGLYIQHGDGTFVDAVHIGRNAWFNQGVTIGYTNDHDCPTLGDNVRIASGAKVLGKITIGDNVTVGANAVVLRDVPSGASVSPPLARILHGVKSREGEH